GLYSLISSDNIFAGKLGLKSDSFPKYQIPICSDFEMEFFLIESLPILNDNTKKISWKVELTPKTKRVPQHFLSLIDMINGTRQDIETGNVYPESGRKCESCDMSVACSEEIEKAGSGVLEAKAGQKLFSFMSPRYLLTKEQELELKKLREPKNDENQKKMRFRYKKD
ncbi:MAG: hypothetical protein KKA64_03120, partial [Nanoarchaeota archaeon]|nr:hypothetical protein [Nanoarchaeota archaeon]